MKMTGDGRIGNCWPRLALLMAAALVSFNAPAALLEKYEFRTVKPDERQIVCLPPVEKAPVVDGVLDDPAWAKAWKTDKITWNNGQPAPNATVLSMAYDANNLYIALQCAVADAAKLKTAYAGGLRNKGAWGDDCIEVKLSPDNGRTEYQFIVTAKGAFDDLKNSLQDWDAAWTNAAKIGQTDYIVEMAVLLKEIGLAGVKPGTPLLVNVGRVDRTTATASSMTCLAEPYIVMDRAPIVVLGTEAEYRALISGVALLSNAEVAMYLDRDQYPSFQPTASGRIRIKPGAPGQQIGGQPALVLTLSRDGREISSQRVEPLLGTKLDFDLPLAGLAPGTYALQASLVSGEAVIKTQKREFLIVKEQAAIKGRVNITIPAAPAAMSAWSVTFGVPFPWGALDSEDNVSLLDAAGREIPVQVQVTGRWSKQGSIRWLLLDSIVPVGPEPGKLALVYGPDVRRKAEVISLRGSTELAEVQSVTPRQEVMKVERNESQVSVDTGVAKFVFPLRETPGLAEVYVDQDGDGIYQPAELMMKSDKNYGAYLVDEAGKQFLGGNDKEVEVVLESSGPLKACVRVAGWHVAETGEKQGKYVMRYYAYAGQPFLRVYHTFIITSGSNADSGGAKEEVRYRDIAYSLPFASSTYCFGTPKVNAGRFADKDAYAYLLQCDDQLGRIYDKGVFKDEFEKAEGWMTIGNSGKMLTVAVKDFWQNYPKELEVAPQKATIHFWPAHGADPVHNGTNLSVRTVYHNWFVHEGKLLDFKIPKETMALVLEDTGKGSEESVGAPAANAIGLAKTHELMLYFHSADWEQARSRSTSRTFQANLAGACDPAWVCASEVFGPMAPRAPAAFPKIEKSLDETIACIFRQHEQDRDYGMFNFGDAHHNWNWAERRWDLHRIWRNTHHGWTRWPWLMFARTGDKAMFDWADRNARHVADVDHCHYSTKEFAALGYPAGKIVGGICDYKGFVHWSSGGRLCYNSVADAMLWHYYFTGDERSRTAALEHGAALIANGKAQSHREGSGRATSACELYFHTWDNDYLDFLERTVDCLLNTQKEDGSFPQWENFAPFLERYIGLTRSRRGMRSMVNWSGIKLNPNSGGYHQEINLRAYAYLFSGDVKHLAKAAFSVREFTDNQYLGEDPRYRGMFVRYNSNLDQSYYMQWIPYYLYAVGKHGGEPPPISDEEVDSVLRPAPQKINGTNIYLLQTRIKEQRDQPFKLKVKVRGGLQRVYAAEIRALGGKPIRVTAPPVQLSRDAGAAELALDVPADGALEYDLTVSCEKDFFMKIPVSDNDSGLREMYRLSSEGMAVGDGQHFYFNVPADAEKFTILYRPRGWPQKAAVYDPSGKVLQEDSWVGYNSMDTHPLTVSGIKEREGWAFKFYGKGYLVGGKMMPEVKDRPFYFTLQKDKLFTPSDQK